MQALWTLKNDLVVVFRGIVADAIWITRGHSASSYAVFIVFHLLIIATGVFFLQGAPSQAASTPAVAAAR